MRSVAEKFIARQSRDESRDKTSCTSSSCSSCSDIPEGEHRWKEEDLVNIGTQCRISGWIGDPLG